MAYSAADSGVDTTTTQHAISVHIASACADCNSDEDVRWRCSNCSGKPLCTSCANAHQDSMRDQGSPSKAVHVLIEVVDLTGDPSISTSPGGHTSCSSSSFWTCHKHPMQEVRLYCKNCEIPLCDECVETSYKHSSHVVVLLKDALKLQKTNLKDLLGKLREKMGEIKTHNTDLDNQSETLSNQSDSAVQCLNECFGQLIKQLGERKGKGFIRGN